jgi:hypothetical protein
LIFVKIFEFTIYYVVAIREKLISLFYDFIIIMRSLDEKWFVIMRGIDFGK